jgi:hypothetical protein
LGEVTVIVGVGIVIVKLLALTPQNIEDPLELTALTRIRAWVEDMVEGMVQDAEVAGG